MTLAAAEAVPRATLRLQLNAAFTFADAQRQLPYFRRLGISHLYLSPVLRARAGSMHGYDVVDPDTVSPELGGEDGLRALSAAVRAQGMGLILDIVPNHMAACSDNRWWADVLEWGPSSLHARWFDIDWELPDPLLAERVLLPILGVPFGEALAAGDLRLGCDIEAGRLTIDCPGHRLPLAGELYPTVLACASELADAAAAFRAVLQAPRERRVAAQAAARERLAQALAQAPSARARLDFVHDPLSEPGRKRLARLLERQHYRLAWWRCAADEINWRRFFDISELVCVRVEERPVFEAVHAKVLQLYAEGVIDGLRVDHVDGLDDPRRYCRRLRKRLAELEPRRPPDAARGPAYLVVEKILAPGERLPRDWHTDGTTGYAFMNEVGALLHDPAGEGPLSHLWRQLSGRPQDFAAEERRARRRVSLELFSADFNACARALHRIARSDPATRDWSLQAVSRVLAELLVSFPVYRTYVDARGRRPADQRIMQGVVEDAATRVRPGERDLLQLVDRWLGGEPAQRLRGKARALRLRASGRFQQLTAPVAAKAVEDTAFYRHGRLLSRNEVGADPGEFSIATAEFHRACRQRLERYPDAMLATATHDHKRGEDLRARLAVLSEMPDVWAREVLDWRRHNEALRMQCADGLAPDVADEYMLYQTLVGAWPPELDAGEREGVEAFAARVTAWQEKAVREAKRRSGWTTPNPEYEAACRCFAEALLASPERVARVQAFVGRIAAAGAVKALAQALLRLTTPGIPDLYQGTELWDFSLVDPDNRRPVDWQARAAALADADLGALLEEWRDGRIKQRLVARLLALRAQHAALFARGTYRPLRVTGPHAADLVAFLRGGSDGALLVAVPRRCLALMSDPARPSISGARWGRTSIHLPPELAGRRAQDVLVDGPARSLTARVPAGQLFEALPVAAWRVEG